VTGKKKENQMKSKIVRRWYGKVAKNNNDHKLKKVAENHNDNGGSK